jgi:hypothetical protein
MNTKTVFIIMGVFILLTVFTFTCNIVSLTTRHVYNSTANAVISYDYFQETYNSCLAVNDNLKVIKELPGDDEQFKQFTKSQRVSSLQQKLNGLIQDYNAKSREIDKNLWKSQSLPYQLHNSDFSNY